MLPESGGAPYPNTWDEQDRLFPKLPPRLARMALAVNTGLRESNSCGLQWTWESMCQRLDEVSSSFDPKRSSQSVLTS